MRKATLTFIFILVALDVLALGIIIPVLPKLVESFMGGDTARAAEVFGLFGTAWSLMQFFFMPLLGMLSRSIATHGERTIWLPTTCDGALSALLAAGLRLDGFPGLLCWSRPDHPFDRYVPISLALL